MALCGMYPGPRRGPEGEADETVEALHRKIVLMFATVVTGSFETGVRLTAFGLRQTLLDLAAASRTLDQGFYLTVSEAFSQLLRPIR